jgi:hypothetical protein
LTTSFFPVINQTVRIGGRGGKTTSEIADPSSLAEVRFEAARNVHDHDFVEFGELLHSSSGHARPHGLVDPGPANDLAAGFLNGFFDRSRILAERLLAKGDLFASRPWRGGNRFGLWMQLHDDIQNFGRGGLCELSDEVRCELG